MLYWQKLEETSEQHDPVEDDRVRPLLRGLNYLLSDEPDKALDEVVKVAKLRSEATEVYMFLGEMFRNKGEYGRAVRIHQNILARPHVSNDLFIQAQLALATDFHVGGLIDRAVRHYHKVLDVQSDHRIALQSLLRIHEQSGDWKTAIEFLQRLERLDGLQDHHHAYLLAELAQASLEAGAIALATEQAQEARDLNASCVHAHQVAIISGLQSHDDAMVLLHLEVMADATPEMLFLLLPVLLDTDYDTYTPVLWRYWVAHRNLDLALTWLEYIACHQGQENADHWCKKLGFNSETLRDSLRLAALFSPDDELRSHAIRWREQLKHYQCHHCGVQIEALRWQCPQCQQWGTMRSVRQEL
ncbi:MAG: heat-shock protein [Mariprofundaceae bacterium]|nr:heat-shock protein [Mariprofundaceae bacterium]